MTERPQYFDSIRERAAKRWDQLEADPELAGPWHQLFKQVQSPRHILSELLQNADDAGASEAAVHIDDHRFVFTHNGEDFTEEHFASICRFGYSNKRALHTIGFRGVGFKSTFSLGDTVELRTPTLALAFTKARFTEPKWLGATENATGTQIRVSISDRHREREVEKNLQEWLKSPVSLLFFKNIRRLRIGDQEVHWGSLGPGPVTETEWMALHDNPDSAILIARSPAETFPDDALREIKQERMLGIDQETAFPPCKVEIVLGAMGRLYVVLPTGVETKLPFACNAPFIQDPARLKIKDVETSPTNQWLLRRVGALAASVMLQWLGQGSASLVERSRAYGLFPDIDREDNSFEGTCATIVEEAFDEALSKRPILLTNAGNLMPAGQSVIVPEALFDVWPGDQAAALLDTANRPTFSRHVEGDHQRKLLSWGLIEEISKDDVLGALQSKHLPRPESWRRLVKLWAYLAPEITGYRYNVNGEAIRIVPVQGKDVLYSASEVVRLGEKRLLQSESDWDFLSKHLLVLNQNWPRFLAEQRRASENGKAEGSEEIEAAFAILDTIELEDASDVSTVIEQVASEFFKLDSVSLSRCIQLAQIAAKLGANAGDSFRFVTRDRHLRSADKIVLFDKDGTLADLFPESWCSVHLLHPDYSTGFTSCTSEDWLRWVASGRSALHEFVPFVQKRSEIWGRQKIEVELRKRGCNTATTYPYKTSSFRIEDWDFDEAAWRHWTALAIGDQNLWGRVVERVLAQPDTFGAPAKSARAVQVATTGSTKTIVYDPVLPTWILKLRDLPCLPDTRGFYRKPADLLRRTIETESLIDVEPFVDHLLDRESTRPLLALLGVRDTPTGPDRLLDCLRALAQSDKPPIQEVEKWYRRLDQMVDTCSTDDLANIRKAFREEKIALTEGAGWAVASGVFLSSDEEGVPGAAILRSAVRDLALWRKIGIAERPTADLTIQWLKDLPSGKLLSQDDLRRVNALLTRYATRIWEECGHWLNLAREWVSVDELEFARTMQSLVEFNHLHEWVKQKTADLRLPAEITDAPPFSDLPLLASRVEDRFHLDTLFPGSPERKPWLNQFGIELRRIELDNEADTLRIRALAADLGETVWQSAPMLEIVPYIDGAPAGTPRRAEVVWLEGVLYVDQLSNAKLARLVPDRLGKAFGRPDITAALNYCFGRSPADVTEYLEENFNLAPREAHGVVVSPLGDGATPQTVAAQEPPEEVGDDEDEAATVEGETNLIVEVPAVETPPSAGAVETQGELDGIEITETKEPRHRKPERPSLIERFARSQGFQKDGEDRFYHADGSWIGKANGDRFPWERRTATGDIVRHYWAKDHCLERDPLQLEADIWGLIDKFPETYALILSDSQDDPVELSGARLRSLRDGGELILFPATYRLVLNNDP